MNGAVSLNASNTQDFSVVIFTQIEYRVDIDYTDVEIERDKDRNLFYPVDFSYPEA